MKGRCPNCGAKVNRWMIILGKYFLCRNCNALIRYRPTFLVSLFFGFIPILGILFYREATDWLLTVGIHVESWMILSGYMLLAYLLAFYLSPRLTRYEVDTN